MVSSQKYCCIWLWTKLAISLSRVLPTPVARAKHREGNSRSKSVNVGNSLLIAAKFVSQSAIFGMFKNSQIRARISKDSRWGWRRMRRLAMLLKFGSLYVIQVK